MTDQEIEKLRENLGSGYSVKRQNGAITVELVDIWKGVDFAINRKSDKVYKIINIYAWNLSLQTEEGVDLFHKEYFNPSTEAAYVEQLKAKAKEFYGDIKDGDRFVLPWIGNRNERNIHLEGKYDFYYYKKCDTLELHGFPLYNQGKWAKKVEEPIRVEFVSSSQGPAGGKIITWIQFEVSKDANIHSSGIHLAKCLEDYLNKS